MSTAKNERLLNLLIALMSTRQFVSAERLRRSVVAYGNDDSVKGRQAFDRKFDRDKEELRELGVEIETGRNSAWDDTIGYRIARRNATLPPIELDPAEAAAVGIATSLWQSATYESASQGALMKLKAAGMKLDEQSLGNLQPQLRGLDPSFDVVLRSATDHTPIAFDYRAQHSDSGLARRTVQPWGLVSWKARWYIGGYDVDRQAPRVFRLSRVVGDIERVGATGSFVRPDDVDLTEMIRQDSRVGSIVVTLRLHDVAEPPPGLVRMSRGVPQPDAADQIAIEIRDTWALDGIVGDYGPAIEVLAPAEAREAARAHLERLATLDEEAG